MPFYGNITDRKNQFTYDKIYPSLNDLMAAVSATSSNQAVTEFDIKKDDGVLLGRYVLIDYSAADSSTDSDTKKNNDIANYSRHYDSTVWQKVYANGQYYYTLIADFTQLPIDEIQSLIFGNQKIYDLPSAESTSGLKENAIYKEKDGNSYKYYRTDSSGNLPTTPIYDTSEHSILALAASIKDSGAALSNTQIADIRAKWPSFNQGGGN